jgi:two-component system phosphate regulon sensor histidine kinase PhoR
MREEQPSHDRKIMASMIDALPEAVLIIDVTDRIIALNVPAQTLFPALHCHDFLAWSLRAPDVLDAIVRARAMGQAERVTWLERVPIERLFEVNVAPMLGKDMEPALILSLRDLSEGRRVERMRVDFIANASHELRTPLASLLGFIETLQGPARDDVGARVKFLAIMQEQAQRMARLIDDLLSLSRIEQSLHLMPRTPVDLVAILRHIVDTLTPMAQNNNVTLKLIAPETVMTLGDRDELLRVAENLVENAIKYGASDASAIVHEVTITINIQKNQCILSVRDQGPGIAKDHLPRLTERFYRVDVGQSRAKGGTGLGLAIVKHIVARHRGRLTIESEPGHGANFTISLPLQ